MIKDRTSETGLRVFTELRHLAGSTPNGRELSRLISAAIVSQRFCDLLLSDAATALRIGYNGESFQLAPKEHELVLAIRVSCLADFAAQVATNGHNQPTAGLEQSPQSSTEAHVWTKAQR